MPNTPPAIPTPILGGFLVLYVLAMYVLALVARKRIRSNEDFVVAGRRLPLSLAWATLLATWFGAGTLLTVTDEVSRHGVRRAALDPFGAGICLILAGLFFARPLWEMKLLTLSDFFRRRFGARAEILSAFIMVPTYFGWIAVQFIALASLLELFFDLPLVIGIPLVAVVAMGYTLLGGMWSVTLTDAVQITLVLAGLVVLAVNVLVTLGAGNVVEGWLRLTVDLPPRLLEPLPTESLRSVLGWFSVLLVGALGNIPGQDLLQRVFAARSARVAQSACVLAGIAYLVFGCIPILLGLASHLLVPGGMERSVLPALARIFFTPAALVVFTVALTSAVLSTIDSAILSPASVLAQNVFGRGGGRRTSLLALNRLSVVLVTAASVIVAFLGDSAYGLLEDAYELPLVSLFVPLSMGLFAKARGELPAILSMSVGVTLWLIHYVAEWETFLPFWLEPGGIFIPVSLGVTACSLLAYLVTRRLGPKL
jgi:Na+/proline symporter